MPTRLLEKAREKGLQESLRLGRDVAETTLARFSRSAEHSFIFLSPPINNSGAPLILMQIVEEYARRKSRGLVRLLSPGIDDELRERAQSCGVRVERAAAVMGNTLVGLQLALQRDDLVLMNTVGVLRNYQEFIFDALGNGTLAHAYWYIHEDTRQLPSVAPFLLDPAFQSSICQLVEQRRLSILAPSRKVKMQYDRLFDTERTRLLPYRVELDAKFTTERPASDYTNLNFLLSGKPTDGRKGHVIALAAFHEFMKSSYERDPGAYRPFSLTLVGMTDDLIAEQIRSVGSTILGERLKIVSGIPHGEALEITRRCNAVICCSLNEALPVYVLEGMSMSHVVLRNDAAGMEEQLHDGLNGFSIDSRDIRQFAQVLEVVLNRQTTSDVQLQAMGKASQDMVAGLRVASYVDAIELAR